jgi:citrate lyase subunit beta/citryl-CoA lyase
MSGDSPLTRSDACPLAGANSFLFVPGHRPDRFAKAASAGAHRIIIDLEDAVAPDDKVSARRSMRAWCAENSAIVRINGVGTPWFEADLDACGEAGVEAVMVPKPEEPDRLAALHASLGRPLIPLIETARGLDALRSIATTAGVARLAFGAMDLALDMGLSAQDETLDGFRLQLTLASRLADLPPPIDGVLTRFLNKEKLVRDVARVRGLGFDGKLCIHPTQIGPVNQGFRPSKAELEWANGVVAMGEGVTVLASEMIDRPIRERALRILRRGAIA